MQYTDPGPREFDASIERAEVRGSSAFVAVPFDVHEAYGTRGRVPVWADFDGEAYRGSLVTYGNGHLLLVLAEIQERIGKGPGDTVHVTVKLDTAVRVVELDADVADAFTAAGVTDRFRAMSYSHQREYTTWIAEAAKPETRARRIASAIDRVAEGAHLK